MPGFVFVPVWQPVLTCSLSHLFFGHLFCDAVASCFKYCLSKVLCPLISALLRLSSMQQPLDRISHPQHGVSRSRCSWYRGRGARPGACSDAPPSRRRHGQRRPNHGLLGETGSSSSASTSTTRVSTTRPPFTRSQKDLSRPSPGVCRDGCTLPGFPIIA